MIVKVPPTTSSAESLRVRARSASSATAGRGREATALGVAHDRDDQAHAGLGRRDAKVHVTVDKRASSLTEAFSCGKSRRVSTTARATKGR